MFNITLSAIVPSPFSFLLAVALSQLVLNFRPHFEPGGAQGAVRGPGEVRQGDFPHAQLLRLEVLHLRHPQLRQRHRTDVPHQ